MACRISCTLIDRTMGDASTARMLNNIQGKTYASLQRISNLMRTQPPNVQAAFMNARDIINASAGRLPQAGLPPMAAPLANANARPTTNNYFVNARPYWNPYAHFMTAPAYPRAHDPYFGLPLVRRTGPTKKNLRKARKRKSASKSKSKSKAKKRKAPKRTSV